MISQTETAQPLTLADRRAFLKLPMEERRRILAEQAERVAAHYEQEPERRGKPQPLISSSFAAWTPGALSASWGGIFNRAGGDHSRHCRRR